MIKTRLSESWRVVFWWGRQIDVTVTSASENKSAGAGTFDEELQVCLLIAKEGLQDKQIATRLGISTHTVRAYPGNMHRKLRIDAREKLIIWAYENRVIKVSRPGATAVNPVRRRWTGQTKRRSETNPERRRDFS